MVPSYQNDKEYIASVLYIVYFHFIMLQTSDTFIKA